MGADDEEPLEVESLPSDPVVLLRRWYEDAERASIHLPNAMALATASRDGRPSIRHVLLRAIEDRGFVFYTNLGSRKGRELAENPWAAFSIYWKELDRQISVTGDVSRVSAEESDAYFATRPREARLGAWASRQSTQLGSRQELMERFAALDAEYGEHVPRPSFWGGFRVDPSTVEFWTGRQHRLHDRFLYERAGERWTIRRLAP
ncbi:MAG: pyridoxamine 5'-phosphate oxidase [Actinomycetota bacterium]